jgi:hypothetical protein
VKLQVVDEEEAGDVPSDDEMRETMNNLEEMRTNTVSVLVRVGS